MQTFNQQPHIQTNWAEQSVSNKAPSKEQFDYNSVMDQQNAQVKPQFPQIFFEQWAIIGRVPMVFFLPRSDSSKELADKITAHGGIVSEQHECFTYQIKTKEKLGFNHFFTGQIYSHMWIQDSIQMGRLLSKEEYKICVNANDRALKLNIGKKKKYTIAENLKLYELVSNQKGFQINQNNFWSKLTQQNIIPERTVDSLKLQWKKIGNKTLEAMLVEMIHYCVDFCFSFAEIPNKEFVERFRNQYIMEFDRLEALGEDDDALDRHYDMSRGESYGATSIHQSPAYFNSNDNSIHSSAQRLQQNTVQPQSPVDQKAISQFNSHQESPISNQQTVASSLAEKSPSQHSTITPINLQNSNDQILSQKQTSNQSATPLSQYNLQRSQLADQNQQEEIIINTRVDNTTETATNTQSAENLTPEDTSTSQVATTTQKLLACTTVNTASSTPAAVFGKQMSQTQLTESEQQNITPVQPSNSQIIELKKVDKLPRVSYNAKKNTNIDLDQYTRPCKTVEELGEVHLGKRMKIFVPSNLDAIDYDKDLFKKQMQLETVEITLKRDPVKEEKYPELTPFFRRSVVREKNEQALYERLHGELEAISQSYGVSLEEVFNTFQTVSCVKSKLIEVLEKKTYTTWNELEDLALQRPVGSMEYTFLLKTKTPEEITRRKTFLGYSE